MGPPQQQYSAEVEEVFSTSPVEGVTDYDRGVKRKKEKKTLSLFFFLYL